MAPILPKKKQALLAFLQDYIEEHDYAPTLTEIAEHFKLSSLATVHEHLAFLETRGFIKRNKSQARGINIAKDEEGHGVANSISLPVLGIITAGAPIEAIEDKSATLAIPKEMADNKDAYILKVSGDSMIESNISDGDYVILEKTNVAHDGEMVVALLDDGSATLKKFYKEKSNIRLQPANKKYKPLLVPKVTIQGRVLGVIRSFV